MGLSNLPAPDEGLLCILLLNTALTTISFFRRIFQSIRLPFPSSSSNYYSSSPSSSSSHQNTFIQEFQTRVPAIRFDSITTTINCNREYCTVCLTRFEPDSEVNCLGDCGHIFHKLCLQRWLEYWNVICPLCRTPLLSSPSSQLVLQLQHDHNHDHEEQEEEEEGDQASELVW